MRFMLLLLIVPALGCHGPLSKPMVDRLDEESQAKVDEAWLNMFSPVDRLDRTLMLDCILTAELHQYGVDHLRLVSEKYVGDGLVVMEVRFDREQPDFDEFSLSYVDRDGDEVRRERFTREEIEDRIAFLYSFDVADEDTPPEQREDLERLMAERAARQEEICDALGPLCADEEVADGEQDVD